MKVWEQKGEGEKKGKMQSWGEEVQEGRETNGKKLEEKCPKQTEGEMRKKMDNKMKKEKNHDLRTI